MAKSAIGRSGQTAPGIPLSCDHHLVDEQNAVTFTPSSGKQAYRPAEVDAFVAYVQSARRARAPIDLDNVSFTTAKLSELGYAKEPVDQYVELVKVDAGVPLSRKAATRRRRHSRVGMFRVLDPPGVPWTVYRRWFPNWDLSFMGGADPGELGLLLFAVFWPPWVLAKFLGVRWVICVERNGIHVRDEKIRGWHESNRRLDELAAAVANGQL